VRIPSNSSLPIQCKDPRRHKITSSLGFKDFEGTSEESAFWNSATEEKHQSLKKKHVDTGLCLLCMIDEEIPRRSPEPEPPDLYVEHEPKNRRRHQRQESISTKRISGGIINRNHEQLEASSQNLKVSWSWYSEEQGIVEWTFQNISSQEATGLLLRNSYYFGNAYWPVYQNNSGFGVAFASKLEPLVDKSVRLNSAPLGIISWKEADGSYKNIVSFVFTLSSGQTWRMLEGGFSRANPPQNISVFEVTPGSESDFTITYDQMHVDVWNEQTNASDAGYAPNPSTFKTMQLLAPPEAPFAQLFDDLIQQGIAPPAQEKKEASEEEQQASLEQIAPTPSYGHESKLWSAVAKYSGSVQKN
jgi:hypothetical protein